MTIEQPHPDILDSPLAGPRVVRGTALRTIGYFVGLGLALVAIPVLTRYLGVADYGTYVVVGSLLAIAMILADPGLSVVGAREYAVRDAAGRARLMQSIVTARIIASVIAGVGVVVFSIVAGYDSVLVAGVVLGVVGLVFTMTQFTYSIPLVAGLRFGLITTLELVRNVLGVVGILALVGLGAGLIAFFALPIPIALILLAATLWAVNTPDRVHPAIRGQEWRYLLAEALPAGAASMLSSLFYRVAIVTMSLIATAQETGYFGLSSRVAEVFIAVPWLIIGSAFPVLARAAETDQQRLVSAFQQLFDVSVILSAGTAFALVAGAEPAIAVLGGSEFAAAVPVLRIQGVAVALTFLVTLFGAMLWIVRAKRQLVIANLAGLVSAIALTAALVPVAGAKGAALAMLVAEVVLAMWLAVALFRMRPDLRPSLRTLGKSLIGAIGAAGVVLTGLPPVAALIFGASAYVAILLALRAIPYEIWRATFSRTGSSRNT